MSIRTRAARSNSANAAPLLQGLINDPASHRSVRGKKRVYHPRLQIWMEFQNGVAEFVLGNEAGYSNLNMARHVGKSFIRSNPDLFRTAGNVDALHLQRVKGGGMEFVFEVPNIAGQRQECTAVGRVVKRKVFIDYTMGEPDASLVVHDDYPETDDEIEYFAPSHNQPTIPSRSLKTSKNVLPGYYGGKGTAKAAGVSSQKVALDHDDKGEESEDQIIVAMIARLWSMEEGIKEDFSAAKILIVQMVKRLRRLEGYDRFPPLEELPIGRIPELRRALEDVRDQLEDEEEEESSEEEEEEEEEEEVAEGEEEKEEDGVDYLSAPPPRFPSESSEEL
ncbi:hypothetical protein BJ508DRAFT_307898 [Ascobolus immersus RN42]|uniref:Uncharacterized protein n=1 Tax=Ascobolus immersus RN42 TaxID=1160509 RepID=A0A3N4I5P3_ASCIM|nr:hypothetical protein BJ508DRAFT_307898 [Ascobolus immersus RN42]